MNIADLESLGFTKQQLFEKIVEQLVESISDPEKTDFESRIQNQIKKHVDGQISKAIADQILPHVGRQVDEIVLQETNSWGEKTGQKCTFIEYLVKRTDHFIREEVNHSGKTRGEDSYSWTKHSTRIAFMIDNYLQYNIEKAMLEALGNVNSSVRKGLEEACKIALAGIKVTVNTQVKTQ